MKLKTIPANTVVHTPTEAEAKELLAILHENGYKWCTGEDLTVTSYIHKKEGIGINIDNVSQNAIIVLERIKTARIYNYTILTLPEFKSKYFDEEKPQPKFKVGDMVRVKEDWAINTPLKVEKYDEADNMYKLEGLPIIWLNEVQLEPYTEPETKDEAKDTKDDTKGKEPRETGNNPEISQLDLSELLKGHEGETFYSPVCGTDIELKTVFKSFLVFYLDKDDDCTIECETRGWQRIGTLDDCGIFKSITYPNSACLIYPSRAIYVQYPLDPYTAWMKWQEEQKKEYGLGVVLQNMNPKNCELINGHTLLFRTPADRDKCIEEIKAIIEKYSKR